MPSKSQIFRGHAFSENIKAMFLYINSGLVNDQPIEKCFILSCSEKRQKCCLPTKGVKNYTKRVINNNTKKIQVINNKI